MRRRARGTDVIYRAPCQSPCFENVRQPSRHRAAALEIRQSPSAAEEGQAHGRGGQQSLSVPLERQCFRESLWARARVLDYYDTVCE